MSGEGTADALFNALLTGDFLLALIATLAAGMMRGFAGVGSGMKGYDGNAARQAFAAGTLGIYIDSSSYLTRMLFSF